MIRGRINAMPLRDHFRSPLDDVTAWEGFHGQWPAVIVQQLGKKLPPRYVAAPRIHSGSQDGGATAVWAPALPTLAVETELPDADEYEVRVYDIKRGRRLVAAVEIVSPANKDRPEHRRLFVAKCAALLQQRVAIAILDLVTVRDFNLYADLLEMLRQRDPSLGAEPPSLYAVACRWRPQGTTGVLETWNQPLALGRPLPTLPLWLTDSFAVPLELEESYEQTCLDLRLP
jgi:Protein of unknown function (DUF4058)